ncbi:hypothetical protein LQW54_000894 [Pestalotiopsis sp. IQ-011]
MPAIAKQQAQFLLASTPAVEPAPVDQADSFSAHDQTVADILPAEVKEMDPCVVCTFVENKEPRACLPCGHSMHPSCIRNWVETLRDRNLAQAPDVRSNSGVISAASLEQLPPPTCPMCRASIVYSCGHAALPTEFETGAIGAGHWTQSCVNCQDDEHGYDEFDDSDEDEESGEPQSNDPQSHCRECLAV